ncbi:MAG TPA: ABC transporter permease, partial [Longimicrobiales bacterium]|nr:ABC transporter permease [Longimicrobiales bacterium]
MMKFREILRFELAYQLRRPWPWLAFAVLVVFSFQNTRAGIVPVTLPQDFILNSPFIIAAVTVFSCLIWLLVATGVAGEAGARDVHTGMHPLTYTLPISRAQYLGGRFLAAFALNAMILVGVQVGSLLAAYAPGIDPLIIGPFRPSAYLAAYAFIALPNALIVTATQFSLALVSGRSMASYLGSMLIVFLSVPVSFAMMFILGRPDIGKLTDPLGMLAIMNAMMLEWTIVEKNVRMFTLEGPMLWNRLLWIGISLATLALLHAHFRFRHRTAFDPRTLVPRWLPRRTPIADSAPVRRSAVPVPEAHRSFGVATQLRQVLDIAGSSFRMLAKNPAGLFLLAVYPLFLVLVLVVESQHWGVPMLLRTGNVLNDITSPLTQVSDFRVIVPLLVVYFAGELVWRERDAGLAENIDATSVPEWVLVAGKFAGLALLLTALMAVTMVSGIVAQVINGHHAFQPGLYILVLFGLQLPEYLLFAVLALLVHAVVNQKQLGLLVALVAYFLVIFAPRLGIEHNLLIFTAGPEWSYTDMRGFGTSLGPWLWFKLYWAAWALLLAVLARLLWVRGRESGLRARLRIAQRRITRATAGAAAIAVGLIVALGGFIFYNTNVLNEYRTTDEQVALAAEYERRYGHYEGVPQPEREATRLHIEIHPDRGAATMRGSYLLVNRDVVPIDSVHVETLAGAETRVAFDRAVAGVMEDRELGHSIHVLEQSLQPGDSITLDFDIAIEPRGFRNGGAATPITPKGTHFTGRALPLIGYQPDRELTNAADRRRHGLPRQVTFPTPDDVAPEVATGSGATFDAVMVTDAGQVAVAPGVLRRTWTDDGRRYFHYSSDVPIVGQFMFFSADYAVHTERWNGVEVQVYTDPRHTQITERLLRSVRASL